MGVLDERVILQRVLRDTRCRGWEFESGSQKSGLLVTDPLSNTCPSCWLAFCARQAFVFILGSAIVPIGRASRIELDLGARAYPMCYVYW